MWLGCPWPCADQGAGQRGGGEISKAKCKQPDQNITYFFPTPFYAPGPINHLKILIELFQPKYSSIFSLPNDFLLWHRLNARFCRELKNTFDDLTVLRWLLCGARRAAAALSLALCKCSENRRKNKCSLVLFGLYPMICDFWFTLYTWVHSSEPETVKTNVGAGRANCLLALKTVQMVSTFITCWPSVVCQLWRHFIVWLKYCLQRKSVINARSGWTPEHYSCFCLATYHRSAELSSQPDRGLKTLLR